LDSHEQSFQKMWVKDRTRHRTPHGGRFAPLQAPFHRSKMSTPVVDKTGKNLLAGGGGCAYL
jgi:hypothetical protein